MAEVTVSNSQEHPVPDASASATGNEKISFAAPQQQHPNQELDGKKKRLLEELESALAVTKDCVATPIPKPPNCLGFGIEVIDETALLDSIPKKINVKQSRRRTSKKIHKKTTVTAVAQPETEDLGGVSETEMKNKKYSRDEMEALRFVNVSKQRKFWKTIYAALQSAFADEYDTLVAAAPNNRQPLPFVPNKKPIITG
jgi:survival of motor neuron protein-interacting protein 1